MADKNAGYAHGLIGDYWETIFKPENRGFWCYGTVSGGC